MEVVDRHGWVEGMTIKSYGRHIGFRSDQPGIIEQFHDLFPPGWERSDHVEVRRLYSLRTGGKKGRRQRNHLLYMNASRLVSSRDYQWMLDRLEADLHLYVAERADRRIFVHAGVVAYNGKALLLPGRTMAGKTTLVEELLKLGATYYSDEYAVISESGRVYPFPRRLSVRRDDVNDRPDRRQASEYGAPTGIKAIPIGLVALTGFKAGATFRPRSVAGGRAILALLEHTVPARRRPRASIRTLDRALAGATVVKGVRGEARRAAEMLLARMV